MMYWLSILFAIAVGTLLPVQAGINAQLGKALGHPLLAASSSFLSGGLALVLFTAVAQTPLPALSRLPQVPWYFWLGGLLGAMYLTATIVLAPILGAAVMIGLVIAGQLLAAVTVDHFGLVGFPVHPFSLWRAVGLACLLVGVVLVQRT